MIKLNSLKIINSFSKQKGFTLIELMIAISILSMLLFTGSYSYSLMSKRWDKELGGFSESARTAKNLELLQRLLEGVQPFIVVDKAKKPSFFFIGNKNSLLAVSRTGLFETEYPVIFRLTAVEKEKQKIDLVFQSASTKNVLLIGSNQKIEFNKKLILFENLNSVEFNYFGWSHLYQKNAEIPNNEEHHWFDTFSGIDNQLMPEKYSVTLVKDGKALTIPIRLEDKPERWLASYFEVNQ